MSVPTISITDTGNGQQNTLVNSSCYGFLLLGATVQGSGSPEYPYISISPDSPSTLIMPATESPGSGAAIDGFTLSGVGQYFKLCQVHNTWYFCIGNQGVGVQTFYFMPITQGFFDQALAVPTL